MRPLQILSLQGIRRFLQELVGDHVPGCRSILLAFDGNAENSLDKGVSDEISLLVQKMMAVDMDKRYQSMEDIRDDIQKLL